MNSITSFKKIREDLIEISNIVHSPNKDSETNKNRLEKLSKEYDIVLIKYNQAQKDYINYLKTQSSNMSCSKYNSESKEIDQACYDEIWKKSGCTTTGVISASSDWSKGQTLNGLIYDSFLWATRTDSQHRDGCYGTTTNFNTATEPKEVANKFHQNIFFREKIEPKH